MLRHLPCLPGTSIGFSLSGLCLFLLVVSPLGPGVPPGPVEAQNCVGDTLCEPTVRATSRSPGATTSYEVTFVTPVELEPLTGSIIMELDEDSSVPSFHQRLQDSGAVPHRRRSGWRVGQRRIAERPGQSPASYHGQYCPPVEEKQLPGRHSGRRPGDRDLLQRGGHHQPHRGRVL